MKLLSASMAVGLLSFGAVPTAGAVPAVPTVPGSSGVELPEVVIDSASFVDDVRGDLAGLGIEVPGVDKQITDSVDAALLDVVPGAVQPEQPAEPVPAAEAEYQAHDPNYVWKDDLPSRVLAGKPQSERVLHRAPGSFYDAPRKPAESEAAKAAGTSLYGPGTPLYVGDQMCTLTAAGYDSAGRKVGLTTGHCGEPGTPVTSADSWEVGPSGTIVERNDYYDYAVIEFGANAEVTDSYNGVTVGGLGGPTPAAGETVCKNGVATGHTCGNAWVAGDEVTVAQLCAAPGDSGAPVIRGGQVVGYVRGPAVPLPGGFDASCRTPLQGQLFVPTATFNLDPVLANIDEGGGVGAGMVLPGA